MAKEKTVYVCSNCGQDSPKWVGKCPSCGEWNTYVEEIVRKEPTNRRPVSGIETQKPKPLALSDIEADDEPRINMHDDELNRVLGGGLVPGSLVLIGGEPGIGKSTLVMQTVLHMPEKKILYVSGEESARQLKLRADRLSDTSSDCLIVCETSLEQIYVHIKNTNPDLVIIDSIQTISTESIESSPGSIAQVRECSASILRFAKETHTPVLLIGHINKEGSIAGPKVLEHIVDTVLQFEGDQHYMYRILRSIKNRFGSTAELGIYEMRQDGLRQVNNPSELLLSQDHEGMSGVAIASAIEGIDYVSSRSGGTYRNRSAFVHAACGRREGGSGHVVRIRRSHFASTVVIVGVERNAGFAAPYILFQSGEVDIGVAVLLYFIHRIVAGNLFRAYGVFGGPTQQHVECPFGIGRIAVVSQHVAVPCGDAVFITGVHIEVGTCEVALIFIVGFKHGAAVTRRRAFAKLAVSAIGFILFSIGLAERVVATSVVHIAVCRIQMEQVGVHRTGVVKPTFGE